MKTEKQIRQELELLIIEKQKACVSTKEKNKAVNDALHEINLRYGKGWRTRLSYTYNDWWQQNNLDGTFAYNGVTDDF